MVLMTVQSLAFGGYMLTAAELRFEVHMQRLTDRQTDSSQSSSRTVSTSMTTRPHV